MAMDEQYLWDRTGKVDPEIARMEGMLARYRDRSSSGRGWRALAVAAAGLIAALMFSYRPASGWKVAMDGGQSRAVQEGQIVETGATGKATLNASSIGELNLEANSRLKVERTRMALSRGTMHAFIWAPPAQFVVDTPSATTIDLGCEYTLQVNDDGAGLLTVNRGWVAFQTGALESFIPAGAACRTRAGVGPGVPYFEDAAEGFRKGVAAFDASDGRAGVPEMLAAARTRDALTLWHLLVRTRGEDRDLVARRFGELVHGVNVAGLQAGDHGALDAAWNALGMGGTDWWRGWKQKW
jgi:hypothetical protein